MRTKEQEIHRLKRKLIIALEEIEQSEYIDVIEMIQKMITIEMFKHQIDKIRHQK